MQEWTQSEEQENHSSGHPERREIGSFNLSPFAELTGKTFAAQTLRGTDPVRGVL